MDDVFVMKMKGKCVMGKLNGRLVEGENEENEKEWM